MSDFPNLDLLDRIVAGGSLVEALEKAAAESHSHPLGSLYVDADRTYRAGKNGAELVVPFWLRVDEQVQGGELPWIRATVRQPGCAPLPVEFAAETLSDPRQLARILAAALCTNWRSLGRNPSGVVDAWLAASEPFATVRRVTARFGLEPDGTRFVDRATEPYTPENNRTVRFHAPAETSATRLGLGRSDPKVARATLAELLSLWPQVLADTVLASTFLGTVGWGLIEPVMRSRVIAPAPLLVFLLGRTGQGKSTHAGIVQCFFGDYAETGPAGVFSSTALALEEEARWYAGAVFCVQDVKAGTVSRSKRPQVVGLFQRAGDGAARRRLSQTGAPTATRAPRTTWFFEGQDLPVADEESVLGRMLVIELGDHPRQLPLLGRLLGLRPRLPRVSRALVDLLIRDAPWDPLARHWDLISTQAVAALAAVPNAARQAKLIAAVCTGLKAVELLASEWGLALPMSPQSLADALAERQRREAGTRPDLRPGERFLEALRGILATGLVRVEPDGSGTQIGRTLDDCVAVLPAASIAHIQQAMGPSAHLDPIDTIARDLHDMGALVRRTGDRLQYRTRIKRKTPPVHTWAIGLHYLYPDEASD